MKISDIKAIMEIVQTRSMSKTAERLFITQSALSQLLSRVEAELDAPLFYRTPGKPLELSDVGEQFYAMAKEVISTYDAFLLGLRTKPLNIGISMRVGKYIIEAMQNAIPNFSPEHYTFSELTLAEREMGVLNHSVDLAFSRLPVTAGPISYFVIRRDPIGIYLRKGSPQGRPGRRREGSKYPSLPISVLDGDPPLPAGQRPSHPEGDGGCAAEIQRKAQQHHRRQKHALHVPGGKHRNLQLPLRQADPRCKPRQLLLDRGL